MLLVLYSKIQFAVFCRIVLIMNKIKVKRFETDLDPESERNVNTVCGFNVLWHTIFQKCMLFCFKLTHAQ